MKVGDKVIIIKLMELPESVNEMWLPPEYRKTGTCGELMGWLSKNSNPNLMLMGVILESPHSDKRIAVAVDINELEKLEEVNDAVYNWLCSK